MLGSLMMLASGVVASAPSSARASSRRCSSVSRSGNCAMIRPASEMSRVSTSTPALAAYACDDRQERVRREQRRLVGVGVDDLGHGLGDSCSWIGRHFLTSRYLTGPTRPPSHPPVPGRRLLQCCTPPPARPRGDHRPGRPRAKGSASRDDGRCSALRPAPRSSPQRDSARSSLVFFGCGAAALDQRRRPRRHGVCPSASPYGDGLRLRPGLRRPLQPGHLGRGRPGRPDGVEPRRSSTSRPSWRARSSAGARALHRSARLHGLRPDGNMGAELLRRPGLRLRLVGGVAARDGDDRRLPLGDPRGHRRAQRAPGPGAAGDRPHARDDPPRLDRRDRHLGQPGPVDRRRRSSPAPTRSSSSGCSSWPRCSVARSPASTYALLFGRGSEPVPGSGFSFARPRPAAVPGYGAPDQYQAEWNQEPPPAEAGRAAVRQGGHATPYQRGRPTPSSRPRRRPGEPIIQDGWQWDPHAQQWVPAPQQPPQPPAQQRAQQAPSSSSGGVGRPRGGPAAGQQQPSSPGQSGRRGHGADPGDGDTQIRPPVTDLTRGSGLDRRRPPGGESSLDQPDARRRRRLRAAPGAEVEVTSTSTRSAYEVGRDRALLVDREHRGALLGTGATMRDHVAVAQPRGGRHQQAGLGAAGAGLPRRRRRRGRRGPAHDVRAASSLPKHQRCRRCPGRTSARTR